MRQIQPDVWETDTEAPFPGLTTHAYLLTREQGNVLFYNTRHKADIDQMAELGGVDHQLLSHEDEVGEGMNHLAQRHGTQLWGHVAEQAAFARVRTPDHTFDQRQTVLGNIELIPTPGHSPGSTCFLVESPLGQRYLFTGDTLFINRQNRWTAGFIASVHTEENRTLLADSLRLLRTLEPDVVFGSAFTGDHGFEVMTGDRWPEAVDQALERLLR
ncbi:MBL fold metallo-hydrolase [Natronospirillum operosum]|uniref:MBL fold metallo-hydrolase n=1 Tax=Natronospirillum operosum TaxID=2759953 RepID=A0A4Z0WF81_9GAMM|nr:MBL fold metallo-hydrolase [Natronospirillum operosum]TGG95670.1 MBL fold metallo-hydrolase [Natronospirillum operosum]